MNKKKIKINRETEVKLSVIRDELNNCYVVEIATHVNNEITQRATYNCRSFDNYFTKMTTYINDFSKSDAITFVNSMNNLP